MKIFSYFFLSILFPAVLFAADPAQPAVSPPQIATCLVPAKPSVIVCEAGGSFLCVNTPPGGVKEDFVLIKGKLNLESSTLGQLTVATQQEYTKQLKNISLSSPATENCWSTPLTAEKNFCVEKNGSYAVRIPLTDLGPYTVFLAASRLQGESVQATVRVSRVITPTVTPDAITYDKTPAHHVRVVLDLLSGCGEQKETCDFIGASTGGVFVTVENQISTTPPKQIRCETNTIQGGAGRFVVGVPVEPGANQFTIRICNAATGLTGEGCLKIKPPSFDVGGTTSQIQMLPLVINGATASLRFKVLGVDSKKCDDSVQVSLNLKTLPKICANADGIYETTLTPEEGYNIISVEAALPDKKLTETIPFTSGKILSPFDSQGNVRPEKDWTLSNALQMWFSHGFFNQTTLPQLQAFLASEKLNPWLKSVTENVGRQATPKTTNTNNNEATLPPYCKKGSGLALRIKVTEAPHIGKIVVTPFQFSEGAMQFSLHAEDVSVGLQFFKDENQDGTPDVDPLPLRIAFKWLDITPILQNGGGLASAYTDCDYKRSGVCTHMPALLVPQHFKGAASPAGGFVTCDRSQKVSEKMDQTCHALNVVDRQTGGFFQEKILDALNNAYACQAGAAVTKEYVIEKQIDPIHFAGKVGLEGLNIHPTGMMATFKTRFGKAEDLAKWPEDLRKQGAGILVGSQPPRPLIFSDDPNEVSLGLALPVLSQLFWGLEGTENGFVLDDNAFKKMGFDFSVVCDGGPNAKGEVNPICNLRPRAQEILGDPIIKFGYLDAHTPLRLVFKTSRAFPLRLHVIDAAAGILQAELADWELALSSGSTRFIVAKIATKVALQISPPLFNVARPDTLQIILKVIPDKSRFWVSEKAGTNTTLIPGAILLSKLEQMLKLALDNYSKVGKEIKVSIPRAFDFSTIGFALPKLFWGANGFDLGWDPNADRLLLHSVPVLQ